MLVLAILGALAEDHQSGFSEEKPRFTIEHFALAGASGYLDGPRQEDFA
jgi:hypothetical protein